MTTMLTCKDVKKMYKHEDRTKNYFGYDVFLKYQLETPNAIDRRDPFVHSYSDLYLLCIFIKMVRGMSVTEEEKDYRDAHTSDWRKKIQGSILMCLWLFREPVCLDKHFQDAVSMTSQVWDVAGIDRERMVGRYRDEMESLAELWVTR